MDQIASTFQDDLVLGFFVHTCKHHCALMKVRKYCICGGLDSLNSFKFVSFCYYSTFIGETM